MKNTLLTIFAALPVLAWATFALAPAEAAPQEAEAPPSASFQVDPVHSSVLFRILHNRVAPFYGRFNEIQGSFTWDGADIAKSKIELKIPVSSVDTHDAKRDEHLRSPDFFNERRYPTLSFVSDRVEGSAQALKVHGKLSLHGVEQEITADARFTGYAETQFGKRAGFEATFTVDRMAFGIEAYPDNLSKEVQVTIALEAIQS